MAIAVAAVLTFTATPARDPADHPARDRQGHGAGREPFRARLVVRRLRGGDPRQLRGELGAGDRGRAGGGERALRHAPGDVRAPAAGVAQLHGQDRGRPADVAAAGRRELDAGVPRDLGALGRRHRAAVRHRRGDGLARLAARPADAVGAAGPVRRPADLAAAGARSLHGGARDQLDRQRRAGRGDQRRARGAEHGPPARQLQALRRQGAGEPRTPTCARRGSRR